MGTLLPVGAGVGTLLPVGAGVGTLVTGTRTTLSTMTYMYWPPALGKIPCSHLDTHKAFSVVLLANILCFHHEESILKV